jgi:hypothetical protein
MQVNSPTDLAVRLFSHDPGSLGRLDIGISSKDNEFAFQILVQIALSGVQLKGLSFSDLTIQEILDNFNQHFMWLGYKANFRAISNNDLNNLVYYCSFNETTNLLLNRFHPFRLIDSMDDVPDSYNILYNDQVLLNKTFAVRKYQEGGIVLFFNKITFL